MTILEDQLYLALLGARTIVAATANVNPRAYRVLALIDNARKRYLAIKGTEEPQPVEETDHAAGN